MPRSGDAAGGGHVERDTIALRMRRPHPVLSIANYPARARWTGYITSFRNHPRSRCFCRSQLGYFIGQINFGKFQLGGVGGSLLAAVVISQAGVTIDNGVKSVMFAVFIYAVGYDSGPRLLQFAEPQDAA